MGMEGLETSELSEICRNLEESERRNLRLDALSLQASLEGLREENRIKEIKEITESAEMRRMLETLAKLAKVMSRLVRWEELRPQLETMLRSSELSQEERRKALAETKAVWRRYQ